MQSDKCYLCGETGHWARFCPIKTKCFGCGQYGHMKKGCPAEMSTGYESVDEGDDWITDELMWATASMDNFNSFIKEQEELKSKKSKGVFVLS